MEHQTKNMIVNALINVVNDAPTSPTSRSYQLHQSPYGATKESFEIWIQYVYSVMGIISSYVNVNTCVANIQNIAIQENKGYNVKTNSICQIILDFAKTVLYM